MTDAETMNWTRSIETEEEESNARTASSLLIDPTSHADGRDSTIGAWALEARVVDLCTRLPPPPVPPWLKNSPNRLRHLLANCSCWEKYTDLCSVQNNTHQTSSQTLMEDAHSKNGNVVGEYHVPRFIPFLAAIMVGLLMVGVVAFTYFWHQRKRRIISSASKLKYQRQPSPSRDYCSPGLYMTPSVTIETQLSLCALEDDTPHVRPYSIYKTEGAWPRSMIDVSSSYPAPTKSYTDSFLYDALSSSRGHGDEEILLHPERLEQNGPEPLYTPSQNVFCDNFVSTHSLPIETAREYGNKRHHSPRRKGQGKQKHDRQPCASFETNDIDSAYVQLKNIHDSPNSRREEDGHLGQSGHHRKASRVKDINSQKGVVRKCQDARNRVLSKLPWTNYGVKSGSVDHSTKSTNGPFYRSIRSLRSSLKGIRSFANRDRQMHHTHDTVTDPSDKLTMPLSNDDHSCS